MGRYDIVSRFQSSKLLRNILAVASGTATAQLVVMAFSPLITRIYSPEVFGLQGVFLSLISMLSPVIALRYPMAIITAQDDSESLRIGRLSLLIASGIACLLLLILLVAQQKMLVLLGAEGLGALILLLPFALFFVALQDVADFQTARLGVFRIVGIVSVLQAFATNLVRVLGGLASPVAAILVAVTSLNPAVKAAMLRIGTRELRKPVPQMDRAEATSLLKKHRDFPLFRMPTDLMDAVSQTIPVIMLSALFSPSAAGLYALARSVINLPLNILGSSLGNVLYAKFAELNRENKPLFPLVFKTTLFQLFVPGGLLSISALFFPALFALVFGEAWRASGTFAQWMSLWVICMLTNVPTVRALPVIRCQGWHFFFSGFILLGGIIGMLSGYWIKGTEIAAVAFYSSVVAVVSIAQIVTYLIVIRNSDRKDGSVD